MKKLSLIFLSLALLLVGTIAAKAVTQSAFDGTNFSGFNFNNYVQNEVYKWIYESGKGCIKVKQSSLSTSQEYFDTEEKCLSAHKTPSYSYTNNNLSGMGLSNSNLYVNKPTNSSTPKYTTTDQSNLGNSGFNLFLDTSENKTERNSAYTTGGTNNLSLSGFGTQFNSTVDKTDKPSLFGTGINFGTNDLQVKDSGIKPSVTGNFFTNLITSLGFGGGDKITTQGNPDNPDEPENPPDDPEEVDGTIAFTYSPSKTYAKGETIKIKVTKKPKTPTGYTSSFWYDLKVDWKNTPSNTSDDIVKEANAITNDEFEIKTDGYYRIEITLKASTIGPSPKYEYKEYESKSVALTLDEQKKEGIDDIENDCYLDIIDFKPITNGKIVFPDNKAKAITVTFKLNCTSYDPKYFDVKPLSVSAYIDVPALKTNDISTFKCESKTFSGKEVYKKGTDPYTITCDESTVKSAIEKVSDEDTRNRFLMVDMYYLTNKKTGTNYGEEHQERFISTRDKVPISTTTDNPPKKEEPGNGREMNIDAVVNPSDGVDTKTFKDCKGGTVKITWSSKNYDTCSISSDTLVYVDGSGKEDTKEFKVGQNTKSDVSHHIINLTCTYLENNKQVKDKKGVQINVPKCEGNEEGDEKSDSQDEESWGKKCKKTKCEATYGLGSQISLKMNDNKVLNARNFKFAVKLSGDTCDLNVFQKTFARLKVDGKIIQDITIPHNTKEREYTFGNIWEQLSEQTKKNIEETLKEYNTAPVIFYLESWSTFDEVQGRTNKKVNCNWTKQSFKVTFVKETSGSGTTDKITQCKQQCKKNYDNLSEQEMINIYEGTSRGEAYENCIAKCEGKTIPYPKNTTQKQKAEDYNKKYCSYVTPSENKKLTYKYIPEVIVHIKDNSTYMGIVEVEGYLLINNEKISLPKWRYQNYPAYPEGVKTIAYITHINTDEVIKQLEQKKFSSQPNAKMIISTYAHDFNTNKKVLCDIHEIELSTNFVTPACEFSIYGGQTLQLLKSQNGDFRNVDYQNVPALVLYPYGNVIKCNKYMSNFNFELIWDQKTSDIQRFSAVDCSRSCFKQLAYKFDRSKANVFAQKALENKGQSIYAGKLTINLVNTKDSTFKRTFTQNIFFRYPPGQP